MRGHRSPALQVLPGLRYRHMHLLPEHPRLTLLPAPSTSRLLQVSLPRPLTTLLQAPRIPLLHQITPQPHLCTPQLHQAIRPRPLGTRRLHPLIHPRHPVTPRHHRVIHLQAQHTRLLHQVIRRHRPATHLLVHHIHRPVLRTLLPAPRIRLRPRDTRLHPRAIRQQVPFTVLHHQAIPLPRRHRTIRQLLLLIPLQALPTLQLLRHTRRLHRVIHLHHQNIRPRHPITHRRRLQSAEGVLHIRQLARNTHQRALNILQPVRRTLRPRLNIRVARTTHPLLRITPRRLQTIRPRRQATLRRQPNIRRRRPLTLRRLPIILHHHPPTLLLPLARPPTRQPHQITLPLHHLTMKMTIRIKHIFLLMIKFYINISSNVLFI